MGVLFFRLLFFPFFRLLFFRSVAQGTGGAAQAWLSHKSSTLGGTFTMVIQRGCLAPRKNQENRTPIKENRTPINISVEKMGVLFFSPIFFSATSVRRASLFRVPSFETHRGKDAFFSQCLCAKCLFAGKHRPSKCGSYLRVIP